MPRKPEKLELENLSLVKYEQEAMTPTIRLTVPNSVVSTKNNDKSGINNPAFSFDKEDILKKLDCVSLDIPLSPVPNSLNHLGSSISLSASLSGVDPNGLLAPSLTNGQVSQGLRQRSRCNTANDSLLPPSLAHMLANKRHSLPVPGKVDYLTPTAPLLAPTLSNGKLSNGNVKHDNSRSKSQPSSPIRSKSPWERLFGSKKDRQPSVISSVSGLSDFSGSAASFDGDGSLPSIHSPAGTKLRDLVKSVTQQAKKLRKNEIHPAPAITPASEPSTLAPPTPRPPPKRNRLDSFAPSSIAEEVGEVKYVGQGCCKLQLPNLAKKFKHPDGIIDPGGRVWLTWLSFVAIAFVYNAIVIFLRGTFPCANSDNIAIWLTFDYICDLIYVIDITLRLKHKYVDRGLFVTSWKETRRNYMKKVDFRFDVLSLLPLDLLYFKVGVYGYSTYLRLPRLLKVHAFFEFSEKFENASKTAWLFRVVRTIGYMLYMIHLNTCCYYAVSVWEGIGSNGWVWNGEGNSYIRCCYRATKTLITIGALPDPVTTFEIFFMNVDFIIGIFVFATIIGQMRDILGDATATTEAFRRRMDDTMRLLNTWKIPESVQKRVRMWYMYNWERGELLDEKEIMEAVPVKMQTDLAIHVHMDTLSKVSLFQDCDKMLLRDLVLKLRPVLYLPGDYICTKGEVGKEMYIVNSGIVQVMSAENKVLATLHPGSVFGEISLLAMGGGNRRTADVVSPGFANLFVLSKKDLQEAIVNYPEAQESLKRKAKEIMKKNEGTKTEKTKKRGKSLIAETILRNRTDTPRFFNAVLEVARNSKLSHSILKGATRQRKESLFAEYSYHSSTDSDSGKDDSQSLMSNKSAKFQRRKRSPDKKKKEKVLESDNKPSSFDSAVIVHSSPKSEGEASNDSSTHNTKTEKSKSPVRSMVSLDPDSFDLDSLLNEDKAEMINEEKVKIRKKSKDSMQAAISDIMKNVASSDDSSTQAISGTTATIESQDKWPTSDESKSSRKQTSSGDESKSSRKQTSSGDESKSSRKQTSSGDNSLDGLSDILNDSFSSGVMKAELRRTSKHQDENEMSDSKKSSLTEIAYQPLKTSDKPPKKLPPLTGRISSSSDSAVAEPPKKALAKLPNKSKQLPAVRKKVSTLSKTENRKSSPSSEHKKIKKSMSTGQTSQLRGPSSKPPDQSTPFAAEHSEVKLPAHSTAQKAVPMTKKAVSTSGPSSKPAKKSSTQQQPESTPSKPRDAANK